MPPETDKKRYHVIHTGKSDSQLPCKNFSNSFYIWILEFHNLFRLKTKRSAHSPGTQRSFVAMDLTIMLSLVIIVKSIMVVALTQHVRAYMNFQLSTQITHGDLEIRWNFKN